MLVQLPTPQELQPWIEKLEAAPGSVVLIAVEQPEVCNFARCTCAWLSREERQAIRRALEVCRRKRLKESMQDTKPIDPSTGEPIPNPKPDPNLPDDWPPKPPRDPGAQGVSLKASFRAGVPHLKIGE